MDKIERLTEAIQVMSGNLAEARDYLQAISEALDEIHQDLKWIIENREEFTVLPRDAEDTTTKVLPTAELRRGELPKKPPQGMLFE